jgi:hypothetical protein
MKFYDADPNANPDPACHPVADAESDPEPGSIMRIIFWMLIRIPNFGFKHPGSALDPALSVISFQDTDEK